MGLREAVVEINEGRKLSPAPPPARTLESRLKREEDARLVRETLAGDVKAFETLYRRHSSGVFALAFRMVRNRADAEDLLQEIFLQAHGKLSTFQGRSAFGTWLYRLGVNRCLDYLRSRSAREQSKNDPLEPMLPSRPQSLGSRRLELERAIGELSPSCRAAFLLHDVEGYDHREVGDIMGVAVGTSKSLVHRARLKLRDQLKPLSAGETL